MPRTPALARASCSSAVPSPVARIRAVHASDCASRSFASFSTVSGVPNSWMLSWARQVSSGIDASTKAPLSDDSARAMAAESAATGRTTTLASTGRPLVPSLQASSVASRVRTLGWIRSTWVKPRSQPRQVPYCSLRASIPHFWYIETSQSLPRLSRGEPVSRGPTESIRVWARSQVLELSIPSVQIRWSTGSSTGRFCPRAVAAVAMDITIASSTRTTRRMSCSCDWVRGIASYR